MEYVVGWNQKVALERQIVKVSNRKKASSTTILPACFLFAVLMLQLHVRLSIVSDSYEVEKLRETLVQKEDRIREIKLSIERISEPDFIMQNAKSKLGLVLTPPQRIRKITLD